MSESKVKSASWNKITDMLCSCSNGELLEIPVATGPFELVAINLRNLAYVKVKACSNRFWLMEGDACSLCPEQVGDSCPPGKDTVLLPGRNMVSFTHSILCDRD